MWFEVLEKVEELFDLIEKTKMMAVIKENV
jgi:hypothetical protein